MNYLVQFVYSLDAEERSRLADLDLSEREQQVLHYICSKQGAQSDVKKQAMIALDISSAHFDKTSSTILTKCYKLFASTDENALFTFLNRKNLDALNHHERSKREKLLQTCTDDDRIDAFYLSSFMMLRATNFDRYNPTLTEDYALKYLSHGKKKDANEHARIHLLHLFVLLHYQRTVRPSDFDAQYFHQNIHRCEQLIDSHSSDKVRFELHKTRATLYRFEGGLSEGIAELQSALSIYEGAAEYFRPFDKAVLMCQMAEMLRDTNDFVQSLRIYTEVFNHYEELMRTMFHHINRYAEAAMLNDEFERARDILQKYLASYLSSTHVAVTTNATLSFAKAHIFLAQYAQAHAYLQQGLQSTDKTLFFDSDVEFRNLQTACCFLEGDLETAEILARKNLKFLKSKVASADINHYASYFSLVLKLIDANSSAKPLSPKLERSFEQFQEGRYGVYGKLLRLMRAK